MKIAILAALEREVPAFLMESLREQWQRVCEFSHQLAAIDRRLEHIRKQDPHCEAVSAIPGIGVLTATAAVAAMGDPRTFGSGREFAAWLGLVPRKSGTGAGPPAWNLPARPCVLTDAADACGAIDHYPSAKLGLADRDPDSALM